MTDFEYIRSKLTEDEILCVIAEEASELSKAALKLRRALTDINPTPISIDEARRNLLEEFADVHVAERTFLYEGADYNFIRQTYCEKLNRWIERLKYKHND